MKTRMFVLTIIALSLIAAIVPNVHTSTYTADRYTVSLPAGRWSALTPVVFTAIHEDGTRLVSSTFTPAPGLAWLKLYGRCELANDPGGKFAVKIVQRQATWETLSYGRVVEFWEVVTNEPFRIYVWQQGQTRNPLKCNVTVEQVRR